MRLVQVVGFSLVLFGASAEAQDMQSAAQNGSQFPRAQIDKGAEVYATYCVPCHGPNMDYPGGSFDLRTFPSQQHARFVASVSKGKNNMPPWGDLLPPGDIEALWAYVMAGEKR
jgi:mono/diheme cytochrome c family protein